MKAHSVVVISVFLAFFAANTSALYSNDNDQNVCETKKNIQKDFASIITEDVGRRMIKTIQEQCENMCTDPAAHNGLVDMMDTIADVTTDPVSSQTLGNAFYWIRTMAKDVRFRIVWHETMKGINSILDDAATVKRVMDIVFENMNVLLNDHAFDSTYSKVIRLSSRVFNIRKNLLYNAGAALTKPISALQRSGSRR